MEKPFNPLMDDFQPKIPDENNISILASQVIEAKNLPPLSPITKKPMQKVLCDRIPAYYDAESRLVLPIRE
jgi:hypothetical protein